MTGEVVHQDTRAAILLRFAELEKHLNATRDRLSLAAAQLEKLAEVLLSSKGATPQVFSRPWLEDLFVSQLIADVQEAERRLSQARVLAAELGIRIE